MFDYEQAMSDGWKEVSRVLVREYRHGFEAGYFGRYMEIRPRMSDAFSQGYAAGEELARMEYEMSAAPQQGSEDATYEEMAKGA